MHLDSTWPFKLDCRCTWSSNWAFKCSPSAPEEPWGSIFGLPTFIPYRNLRCILEVGTSTDNLHSKRTLDSKFALNARQVSSKCPPSAPKMPSKCLPSGPREFQVGSSSVLQVPLDSCWAFNLDLKCTWTSNLAFECSPSAPEELSSPELGRFEVDLRLHLLAPDLHPVS